MRRFEFRPFLASRLPASRRATAPLSSGAFNLVGADQKIGGNLPVFAELVDHIDGERAPTRENFRCARARSQNLGQFRLSMAELLDGIVEYVDWVEARVDVDRPSLRLVYFNECEEYVEPVAFLGALRGTPAGLDLGQGGAVIFVGTDRSDLHQMVP